MDSDKTPHTAGEAAAMHVSREMIAAGQTVERTQQVAIYIMRAVNAGMTIPTATAEALKAHPAEKSGTDRVKRPTSPR